MRFTISVVALLAVAASQRGGCTRDEPGSPAIDDECAGLACGASCAYCPDGATQCPVPTFAPTACDARGACVTAGTFSCDPSACEGKKCGDECTIDPPCRSASPPCMMPTVLGYCDAYGQCTTALPSCTPYEPCAGKKCGEICDACAPGQPCPMTAVVTACDRAGACVPRTPWLCYDPCASKACHAPCQLCAPDDPDCAETMVVKWCDGAGACVAQGTGAACPN
jgi:hypothetical protein